MKAWDELQARALGLEEGTINGDLRTLMLDARAAALVAWINRNRMAFRYAIEKQGMADKAGRMAHCAGSLHALTVLEDQLRGVLERTERGDKGEA